MSILDSSQQLAQESFLTISPGERPPKLAMSAPGATFGGGVATMGARYPALPLDHEPAQGGKTAGGRGPVGGMAKRSLDIGVALCALIVLAPLMAVIALLILVTMGRPIVFAQQRVGFGKGLFSCFKFRTMVPDAQERLARYLAENPEAARHWRETQKLRNDPRITWLGHILRKSSLDELPQLFNVLRGDMSCVGPRPVLSSELARYGAHAADYLRAKPGLTGMWQVSGRSNTSYAHRVNCDRYYVRRWSLRMDVAIMLRTIPAVMRFGDSC